MENGKFQKRKGEPRSGSVVKAETDLNEMLKDEPGLSTMEIDDLEEYMEEVSMEPDSETEQGMCEAGPSNSNKNGKCDLPVEEGDTSDDEETVKRASASRPKRNRKQGTSNLRKRKRKAAGAAGPKVVGSIVKGGLRHFATKVCENVREKGVTSYNDVADDLVHIMAKDLSLDPSNPVVCDTKNIRRRVYDALNVLMAMNIITKNKKEIRWVGLPTSSRRDCMNMLQIRNERKLRIEEKTKQLQELISQQVCFRKLAARNRHLEEMQGLPNVGEDGEIAELPFILVNTDMSTHINIDVARNKASYYFMFNQPFGITDDHEVLKCLGLGMESPQEAKSLVPQVLHKFIDQMAEGSCVVDMENLQRDVEETDRMIFNNHSARGHDFEDDSDDSDEDY